MAKTSKQQTLIGFEEPEPARKPGVQLLPPREGSPVHEPDDGPSFPSLALQAGVEGDLAGKSVYIVDSHSLIYQVFHAMPEMTGPSGQPVGAVQGFMRDLVDLIENRKADFLICAFDHPGENFRHEIFPEYKQHREEMPVDLQLQIPVIHRFLEALNIPLLSIPGYEAVSWFGLFGPAGMPPDVVAKINKEVRELFADPEFQKTFLDRYLFQSIVGTPEELTTFIKSEEPKWRKIIQDAKIKVE